MEAPAARWVRALFQSEPAAEAQKAVDPEAGFAPLPIEVKEGDKVIDLARRALGKDTFLALALAVEGMPNYAHIGAARTVNVGAGYCVSARMRALGKDQVRKDLSLAGFGSEEIETLLREKKEEVEQVEVSRKQGLRLLALVKPHYEQMAKKAYGNGFEKLPEHQRASLTYLAYNTGNPKAFKKLIWAAKSGKEAFALRQLATGWRDKSGEMRKDHRLRAWMQAAWSGPEKLGEALEKPLKFELRYADEKGQEKFILARMSELAKRKAIEREVHMAAISQRRELGQVGLMEVAEVSPRASRKAGL